MLSKTFTAFLVLCLFGRLAAQTPITVIQGSDQVSVSRAVINTNFATLATAKSARFTGSGAPGSIALSIQGDFYFDTVGLHTYSCYSVLCSSTPSWVRIDGLASVANDTNVTGSVFGSVLTFGWTGTLAAGRLNSNVVHSVVNDTNVTGTIAAQALTLGWTGTLAKSRIVGTAVFNDQANTFGAFLQDLHLAKLRLSESTVGTLPAAAGNTGLFYVITDGTSASDCTVGGAATASLCRSNGASWVSVGGGGGGGGATMSAQLNDFIVTKTSGTIETIGSSCNATTPCQIRGYTLTTSPTVTISGASTSGNVYWYITKDLILTAGHGTGATLTGSAGIAIATGITGIPADATPLATTTFASNVWDAVTPAMSNRAFISSNKPVAAGPGIISNIDPTTFIQTVSTDPNNVPRFLTGTVPPTPGAPNCTTGRDRYTDTVGLHDYFCDATNTWKQADSLYDPLDSTAISFKDEFISGGGNGSSNRGDLTWVLQAYTGAPGLAVLTSEANHSGIVQIGTDGTSGHNVDLHLSPHTVYRPDLTTGWKYKFIIRPPSVTATTMYVGLSTGAGFASNTVGVRFDSTVPDTNWMCIAINGGGTTTADTTVAATAATWYTIIISSDVAGTIKCSVNASSPVSVAANLPVVNLAPDVTVQSNAAAIKSIDIDFFGAKLPVTRP